MQTGKAIAADVKVVGRVILDANLRAAVNAVSSGYKGISSKFSRKKKTWIERQYSKLVKQ